MIKIIVSVASLLVAGVVFFMYTESAYSKTKLIQADIEQRNQALDKAAELKAVQETLLSRFNDFKKDDIDRLHKLLPDHVDNVRLILDLDHLANTFGMALQNVVINSSASETDGKSVIGTIGASKQKYGSLTLRFTTHGTYSRFIAFMESLESSLRIVDLVSLTLSPETGTGSSQIVQESRSAVPSAGTSRAESAPESSYKYDITIRTYWLR